MIKSIFTVVIALAITTGLTSCNNTKQMNKEAETKVEETTQASNQLDINSSNMEEALPVTTISFDKEDHNFGTIKEGEIVTTTFTVTNTGKEPLVINKAQGSCGCTVPKFEKNVPIAPGASSEIEVQFNSKGRTNLQRKQVKLYGNFEPSPKVLQIESTVTPAAAAQ